LNLVEYRILYQTLLLILRLSTVITATDFRTLLSFCQQLRTLFLLFLASFCGLQGGQVGMTSLCNGELFFERSFIIRLVVVSSRPSVSSYNTDFLRLEELMT
jgi:hypothetical protein